MSLLQVKQKILTNFSESLDTYTASILPQEAIDNKLTAVDFVQVFEGSFEKYLESLKKGLKGKKGPKMTAREKKASKVAIDLKATEELEAAKAAEPEIKVDKDEIEVDKDEMEVDKESEEIELVQVKKGKAARKGKVAKKQKTVTKVVSRSTRSTRAAPANSDEEGSVNGSVAKSAADSDLEVLSGESSGRQTRSSSVVSEVTSAKKANGRRVAPKSKPSSVIKVKPAKVSKLPVKSNPRASRASSRAASSRDSISSTMSTNSVRRSRRITLQGSGFEEGFEVTVNIPVNDSEASDDEDAPPRNLDDLGREGIVAYLAACKSATAAAELKLRDLLGN